MKHRSPTIHTMIILLMSIVLPQVSAPSILQPLVAVSASCLSGAVYLPAVMMNEQVYFEGPQEQEPNNDIYHANGPLRSGKIYNGYPNDQQDYFSINLISGGLISANLANDVGQGVQLVLRDSNDNFLDYAFRPPYTIQYNAVLPGWYYILVFNETGFNNTQLYSLNVTYTSTYRSSTSNNIPGASAFTPKTTQSTQLCDDFNDNAIDRTKWRLSGNSNLIYEQNGVLNVRVTKEQSQIDTEASLEAILGGRHVREISLITTFMSYTGNIPAGAGPDVFQGNGPDHGLKVGPGPEGPGIEISICVKDSCNGEYDDYSHIYGGDITPGESRNIRIAWTQEGILFFINEDRLVVSPPNKGAITDFQFYVYAEPGSALHVTVDNVRIIYAEG